MLPTGLTYSNLAKRFIFFVANCTCGVGRRVFRSSCKSAARRDSGTRRSTPTSSKPSTTRPRAIGATSSSATRSRSSTPKRPGERFTSSLTLSRPIRRRRSGRSLWRLPPCDFITHHLFALAKPGGALVFEDRAPCVNSVAGRQVRLMRVRYIQALQQEHEPVSLVRDRNRTITIQVVLTFKYRVKT